MKNLMILASLIFLSFGEGFAKNNINTPGTSSLIVKGDSIVTATFSISNLGCHSDAANMEKAILQSKGVKDCTVNAQKKVAVIKYSAKKTSKEELTKVIEDCTLCHDKTAKPFKVTSVK